MIRRATGQFSVTMKPQDAIDCGASPDGSTSMGCMALGKVFTGDIEGVGVGTMLTGMGNPKSSAAYVAVERIEGSVCGAKGTFMLVHKGLMTASGQSLHIEVVPDSGTGELAGISGVFALKIEDGKHFYDLEFTL